MDSQEWRFRLDGDEFDINAIAELFDDEAKIVKDEQGTMQLVMDLPFPRGEPQPAIGAAEELLAKLNAICQVTYGNHENVRIGAAGCKDPSGAPMQQFVYGKIGIKGRSRVSVGGIVTRAGVPIPTPKKLGDRYLGAADKDEHLARALYLFGSLPIDWRSLYMVLESAEDAHGGERGLIAKNWVPDGQIKDFKATSNSYKALRLAARHGSLKTGIAQAKLTLQEAQEMIRTILEKWFKASV